MSPIIYAVVIITAVGFICGIILAFASKFMAVPVDEKQEKIRSALPGANCGACGYSGCDGYAAAISSGEASPDKCTPGGETTAACLADILGTTVTTQKNVAYIHCHHSIGAAAKQYCYSGKASCAAANLLYSGPLECKYACLGFGDCAKACDYSAITVVDDLATVNSQLCLGCGKCADACPKGIISIVPATHTARIACSNKEKGGVARKKCTDACIGCMKCMKVCEFDAITVHDNLATIDVNKCTGCGKCADVCPDKCIIMS